MGTPDVGLRVSTLLTHGIGDVRIVSLQLLLLVSRGQLHHLLWIIGVVLLRRQLTVVKVSQGHRLLPRFASL